MSAICTPRWDAIRAGRGDLPPELAGLACCLDQLSSNTSIIGGAVQQLGDTSGYARHFTAPTAGARPTFTASDANFSNGPSMTGNGSSMYLTLAAGFPAATTGTLYAAVRGLTGGATFGRVFGAGRFVNDAGAMGIILEGLNAAPSYSFRNPAGQNSERTITVTAASTTRLCGVGDFTAGGALWTTYKDGVASGANAATAAASGGAMSTNAASIFATNAGASFSGFTAPRVPFLLYLGVQHTAAQVTTVDAWFKWINGIP